MAPLLTQQPSDSTSGAARSLTAKGCVRLRGQLGCCREQLNAVPNEHGRDSDMGSPLEAAMVAALTRRTSSGDACVAEQRDDLVQASPLVMCPAGDGCLPWYRSGA